MTTIPNHVSAYGGTWRVPPEGCRKCFGCCHSVTADPIFLNFGIGEEFITYVILFIFVRFRYLYYINNLLPDYFKLF